MSLKNTDYSYGWLAKFFHWVIFILVALQIAGGFTAESFAKPFRFEVINVHKLMGMGILILVLLRLGWMLMNPKPKLPRTMARWEVIAMHAVQGLLYICLIVMPITGLLSSLYAGHPPHFFGWSLAVPDVPVNEALASTIFDIHQIAAWILIVLICGHALAALKHHFIDKDDVLKRMWVK